MRAKGSGWKEEGGQGWWTGRVDREVDRRVAPWYEKISLIPFHLLPIRTALCIRFLVQIDESFVHRARCVLGLHFLAIFPLQCPVSERIWPVL